MKTYGILCDRCGLEAPSKRTEYYQQVGAIFVRFEQTLRGNLCKRCIHRAFWKMTGISAVAGWWGTISLVFNPFVIGNNVVRYALALSMPPPPPDARVPEVTAEVATRIGPSLGDLFGRVNRGEPIDDVVRDLAPKAGVTPGQMLRYALWVVERERASRPPRLPSVPPAYGFPVVMPVGTPPPLPPAGRPAEPQGNG